MFDKVEVIDGNIIHLSFRSRKDQSLSMFRISEFYESPHMPRRGEYFSVEQFLELYTTDKGHLNYFNYWDGFNIPGDVINEFYMHFNKDLLKREARLQDLIWDSVNTFNDYYVISTVGKSKELFNHELSHAKYYLNESYKNEVNEYINTLPKDIINNIIES